MSKWLTDAELAEGLRRESERVAAIEATKVRFAPPSTLRRVERAEDAIRYHAEQHYPAALRELQLARTALAEAADREKAMREALEPFARFADVQRKGEIMCVASTRFEGSRSIRFEDCVRAAEAVAPASGSDGQREAGVEVE